MSDSIDSPKIFDNTSFSDLMKDIYVNSKEKHRKINELVDTLSPMIRTLDDAQMVVPLIKEYFEVGVKNDELLVKLAAIVQRHITNKNVGSGDLESILTEDEKKQLMRAIEQEVDAHNNM